MLRTLPGDDVRQIMWRFADRVDLQMLVQSARAVARGPVARLVAEGGRNTHEWTEAKADLLAAYDRSGISTAHLEPQHGGFVEGPKNLALALVAFELAWVDAGAATGSLANHLAIVPITECGTEEQRATYVNQPVRPDGVRRRGAFCLTEPLPYVGVETGLLSGKVRIAEWREGEEPTLQVDKRGRFITNMGFANFVTAAVDSADPRITGSCMVILEDTDAGVFDRGVPTRKLVHQLSSTADPVFSLVVPASRIVGGYSVVDGALVPRYLHGEVLEAVFRRTRVTVGLMTAAKLLSSVEPVLRYQRGRFRGGEASTPGTPRYQLGLQQREDALHRLLDVWATGEAAASLGFAAARLFDELDPLEHRKEAIMAERGTLGGTAEFRAVKRVQADVLEWIDLAGRAEGLRDDERYEALGADPLVQFVYRDALANVYCPAAKLWNTGHGATMMREAVSLMGGYGITEDCPGFLPQKWIDAQLEATYEGPEAVQRRQLTVTMTNDAFLAAFRTWITEMYHVADRRPGTGARVIASAMELWLWTLQFLRRATDPGGGQLYHGARQGVTFPLADALCWLLASRCLILDTLEVESRGPENPVVAEGLADLVEFLSDLAHVQAARAAGEVGRIAAELAFGYKCQPSRDEATDASHAEQAALDTAFADLDEFVQLRQRLDGCLTGARLAKDRAAQSLISVMIPQALDYPA
jgi:alkylation response protein AidB-like acyl-CoA dehydrogenase